MRTASHWDGLTAAALAARLEVPLVSLHGTVTSTMDIAHTLAADGAAAGTLVLAEEQGRGRGRSGGQWVAAPGSALLFTLLERPRAREGLGVLSLRIGLALHAALAPWARSPLSLKWPNDLFDGQGKVAGILVEARWREAQVEWVAIGIGINLLAPREVALDRPASCLAPSATRAEVLAAVLPPVRRAAAAVATLSSAELAQWAAADRLAGCRILEPAVGVVQGITADGGLRVLTDGGATLCHSGHIIFAED